MIKSLHIPLFCLLSLSIAYAKTPYSAARNGDLESLRRYRFEGIDLFIPDERGFTPYELAALHADPDKEDTLRRHVETMLWLKEYHSEKHIYGKASNAFVQSGLNALGYDAGSADGIMGKKTEEAIKAYQRDNDLAETGKLGPQWLGMLYQDALKDLQYKLNKLGYNTQGTDGIMGPNTRKVMLQFRHDEALNQPDYPYLDGLIISRVNHEFSIQEAHRKKVVAEKAHQENIRQISYVQAGLRNLGYRIGKVDGMSGSKTANAIKQFQAVHKIASTGEINEKTLEAMRSSFLKDSQKKLKSLGYAVGKPDGKLGKRTIASLRKYRVKQGLTERGGVDSALLINLKDSYRTVEENQKIQESFTNRQKNSSRIRFAQAGLRTLGRPLSIDGIAGKTTTKYIRNFQKQHNLKSTGQVDNQTYARMKTVFLKETQRKLNQLGYKAGRPDGKLGKQTKVAIQKFCNQIGLSTSDITPELIAAVDDKYDNRKQANSAKNLASTHQEKLHKSSKKIKQKQKNTISISSNKPSQASQKVTKKHSSHGNSARGKMRFKRDNGRVVGCNLAGRNIPIEWCEPFYPLPRNNHCEATFKPSNGAVINLWCK